MPSNFRLSRDSAVSVRAKRCRQCSLAILASLTAAVAGAQVPGPGEQSFTVEIPFDAAVQAADCPYEREITRGNLEPAFEYMKQGSAEAVACVAVLEEFTPDWHGAEGADSLVVPFVEYLLGDGSARGMQRHAIFISLLGPLEKIAPDWRWRPEVRAKMPEIILASVIEDPFVANVWATALPEMAEDWGESEAARELIPTIYELALAQAERPPGPRNDRPAKLLRELSWLSHARLVMATRVFDTGPKRIVFLMAALLLMALVALILRRRRATE